MSNFDDFMISQAVEKNQVISDLLDRANTAEAALTAKDAEWQKVLAQSISTSNANVAAAQDEIAKLRAQLQTGWEHSQHFYNTETGQVECECCCKWALDMIEQDKEIATLKAQIATLTAQWEDMRDCVLNERDSLAESGMTSDQINAVLGVIDDHAPAARAKAADAGAHNG